MAQVPYSPVPTVEPTTQGIQGISPNAPGAAFGTEVARAIEGLGQVTEKAGNELWVRAVALQQLDNDAAAKDADAAFVLEAGNLHAQQQSRLGKSARETLPSYTESIQSLREKLGEGLNPAARKIYDGSTRQTVARAVFSAAGHAASENKRYLVNSSNARIETSTSAALGQQTPEEFQKGIETVVQEVDQQALYLGLSEDERNNLISNKTSAAWASRISGIAKTDPYSAEALFKENRHLIRGQDQEKVENAVRTQMRIIGPRNISDAVNQGWAPYMKPSDAQRAVGVEDSLIRVVKEAQKIAGVEFTIGGEGGRRTAEQQAALVAKGVSKTFNSDHMSGTAIDLVPLGPDGKPNYKDREGYAKIMDAMQKASEKLGIPLAEKSKSFTNWDPAHYSLPKGYDVSTAPKAVEEPLKDRVARAEAWAKRQAGDEDTIYPDIVRERVSGDYNRGLSIRRDEEFRNRNVIAGALMGDNAKTLPTTVEELRGISPEVATAWDNLPATKQKEYFSALTRNAKGDVPETPERFRRWQILDGMSRSPESLMDFMNVDLTNEDIPRQRKVALIKKQNDLKAKPEGDPRVQYAMRVLRPQLQAAQVDPAKNKDDYLQFQGALADAIETWQKDYGKVPQAKDIQTIGSQLLAEQSVYHTTWFGGALGADKTPTYKVPPTPQQTDEAKAALMKVRPGVEPTEAEIARYNTRMLYKNLFGKAPSAEAKPGTPSPPMSR